jgi:hypothetical protein
MRKRQHEPRIGERMNALVPTILSCMMIFTSLPSHIALAAENEENGIPYQRDVDIQITVGNSNQLEIISDERIAVLSDAAITKFGEIEVAVNEYYARIDILAAETIKPDGRVISVPKDRILISKSLNLDVAALYMADLKLNDVVFSDLSKGDIIHLVTKKTEFRQPFPDGFSFIWIANSSERYRSFNVALDVTSGATLRTAVEGFSETTRIVNDRTHHSWMLHPNPYAPEEPGSVAPIDREPHIIVSSYESNQHLAHEFFLMMDPKSTPTRKIRELAEAITRGASDRKDQARRIFDYVSTNLTYRAIFLGSGNWTPHDAEEILANKYGDCKDHVTLMRALLSAMNIQSSYALLSTTPTYRSFDVPSPYLWNHVVLYLPEFDTYVDPTANTSSFGSPLDYEAGKVVVLAGLDNSYTDSRIPELSEQSNRVRVKAIIDLHYDGTFNGVSITTASGSAANQLRSAMKDAASIGYDEYATGKLISRNWRGSATLEERDPFDHGDPYSVKAHFYVDNRLFGDDEVRNATPIGPQFVAPVYAKFMSYFANHRTQDFFCDAGSYSVEIEIRLPQSVHLAQAPKNVSIESTMATFFATYTVDDQSKTIKITRNFISKVTTHVCSEEVARDFEKVVLAADRDARVSLHFSGEGTENAN